VTSLESLVRELRQPLTAILSNAQAAQCMLDAAEPDGVEVRVILEEIVTCNLRAAGILLQLEKALQATAVP